MQGGCRNQKLAGEDKKKKKKQGTNKCLFFFSLLSSMLLLGPGREEIWRRSGHDLSSKNARDV